MKPHIRAASGLAVVGALRTARDKSAQRAQRRDVTTNVKRLRWWQRDIDRDVTQFVHIWSMSRSFIQLQLRLGRWRFSLVVSKGGHK